MIAVDKMYVKIVGISPLILQNGRCANPLDIYAKKMKSLTSKRNKTEDDLHAILETQWEAGLYWDDQMGLYMPSENLYAAFYAAAKKHKLGNKCSGILFPEALGYPIVTENHMDLSKLREDKKTRFIKTVVVQRAKTVACRPIFHNWKINFELEFEKDTWDANEIKTVLQTLSTRIGMGVWRPGSPKPGSFGKFLIESMVWEDSKNKTKKEIKGF
jgi:hypothetical protein